MLVVLAAGFVQGLTAFGFALISLPLLALFLPMQQAVPIIVLLSLVSNVVILYDTWKHLQLGRIWLLIVAGLAAVPFGAWLLAWLDVAVMKVAAGLLIMLFAIAMLRGKTFPIRREKTAFVVVGLISGLLNGSISVSGPPVALFLSNQGVDRQTFKANLTGYAIMLNVHTLVVFGVAGMLDGETLAACAWLLPAMAAGVWLGIKCVRMLNDALFKKIALWLIVSSSLWTVLSGLSIV